MSTPRVVLLLSAGAFAAFGLVFLVAPERIGGLVDLDLTSATARVEVRAFYGGLEIGAAAFLIVCALRESWQQAGLAATALMLGGAAFCRGASMLLDAPVATVHYGLLAAELGGTALALWGLALGVAKPVPVKY